MSSSAAARVSADGVVAAIAKYTAHMPMNKVVASMNQYKLHLYPYIFGSIVVTA